MKELESLVENLKIKFNEENSEKKKEQDQVRKLEQTLEKEREEFRETIKTVPLRTRRSLQTAARPALQSSISLTFLPLRPSRAVENRSKYREAPPDQSQSHYGNIMYDRRVVRGNTYAQRILPTTTQAELAEMQKQQEQRRKAVAQRKAREQIRVRTPEALQGRQHTEVQTELYLEELSNIVMENDVQCQTDAFLDKPDTPLFIPAKSGVDATTQIEDGELFDFDREVQSVLEVLVGKVMEQSLLEVMEEEELACLRAQQRAFEERRDVQLTEVQKLQEQERRHTEEKKRRIAQQNEVLKKEKEIAEKIAARAYTQQYLANLVPSIFTSLRCHGFFVNTVQTDVETNFMPWLMNEISSSLDKRYDARSVLDDIIKERRPARERKTCCKLSRGTEAAKKILFLISKD
ncbi:hypothetical protein WMY93_006911 [Mugilogobius chulae]|uniref:Radial spoke head 3 n=1 Tax=Mugilogobius chulae TaxID=88201 RepID=A0AAW0PNR7_9GOBI